MEEPTLRERRERMSYYEKQADRAGQMVGFLFACWLGGAAGLLIWIIWRVL